MTVMDWLRIYSSADIIRFIEALEKIWKQYYPNKIDMLKDDVSIPCISMTYVLNKALYTKRPDKPNLYTPGQPRIHTCRNCLNLCNECKWVKTKYMQCSKNKLYELLKTCMVGKSQIHDHQYHDTKTCASIIGFDANTLPLLPWARKALLQGAISCGRMP